MAVTADEYLPFDSGPGASVQESGWRNMMKHMVGSASGVIRGFGNDCNTFGDSSGMQVKMNTGECFMRGHYGSFSSLKTLAIASNASGNPRVDIVVLRCHFANNNIVVDVVQGTPAGSPVAPSVTQNTTMWETKLADVAVANGAVTITSGNVTDRRVFTTSIAKYSRNSGFSITSSSVFTEFPCNTIEIASGDVVANSTSLPSQFTVNRSGIWDMSFFCGFTAASAGGRSIQIRDSGATVYVEATQVTSSSGINTWISATTTEKFSVGQIVRAIVWQSSGGALSTVAGSTFTMSWKGP